MTHTSIRGLIAPSRWFPPAVKQRIGHLAHAPHRLSPMQSASDNQTPAACTIHQMRQSFQDPAYGFRRFVDTHNTNRDRGGSRIQILISQLNMFTHHGSAISASPRCNPESPFKITSGPERKQMRNLAEARRSRRKSNPEVGWEQRGGAEIAEEVESRF